MNRSETIGKLFAALAKAQLAMDDASKDSENPHFRSKYADLASVRDALRRPFAENGLAYTQFARFNPETKTVEVETMLVHGESGEFVADTLSIPCPAATAHAIGSAITYGRRFSLMAVSGVAPAEEDDGNAASERQPQRPPAQRPRPEPQPAPEPQPQPKAEAEKPKEKPATSGAGAAAAQPSVKRHAVLVGDGAGRQGLDALHAKVLGVVAKAGQYEVGPLKGVLTKIDHAYADWLKWRDAEAPNMTQDQAAAVRVAMDNFDRERNRIVAAIAAAEAGADKQTGELPADAPQPSAEAA